MSRRNRLLFDPAGSRGWNITCGMALALFGNVLQGKFEIEFLHHFYNKIFLF